MIAVRVALELAMAASQSVGAYVAHDTLAQTLDVASTFGRVSSRDELERSVLPLTNALPKGHAEPGERPPDE